MINYKDYKLYLQRIGFLGNSLNTYTSYISQNKLDIFENIDGYQNLNDDEKLIKFSNESDDFREIFDANHNFASSTTFSDLRSGARRYKHYLQYKAVLKSMQEYDEDPSSFDLNGAYIYFSVFSEKLYPVKAICRKNIMILELEEDFRTNGAKNILKKIFNIQGKENINFVDINEHTPDSKHTNPRREMKAMKMSLNQILYGPPGTGKTYNTINRALEIIDGEVPRDRNVAKERFEELSRVGQIEFVTFHQSYGYEEFVEGIKASTLDGNISYDVEGGVFKKLAKKAVVNFNDSKKSSEQIKSEMTIKEKIELFLNESIENEIKFIKTKGGEFRIKDVLKDNIYIYSDSSNYNDNILVLSIEEFYQIMLVEIELRTSKQLAREVFGITNQRQKDTYYLALYRAMKEFKTDEINIQSDVTEKLKNYILIIDEINRGNTSKIFGELITLIEPSKRLGAPEEIRLRLPYSGELFGVPSNLYIIGTMNTADRSIALMDTALRRRFEFVEMMPDYGVLEDKVGVVAGVDIAQLLQKINARVEYLYDRDHAIGHAYFMELNADSSLDDLNAVMRNKIIPLLQEYFYDDWEKIRLVLNDGFVHKSELSSTKIFGKNIDDDYVEEKYLYSITEEFTQESYLKIYDTLTKIPEDS